jgi:hypothetical protein
MTGIEFLSEKYLANAGIVNVNSYVLLISCTAVDNSFPKLAFAIERISRRFLDFN